MKIYRMSSMKDEYRTVEYDGTGQFTECEHCGYNKGEELTSGVKYRHGFGMILCDRCVDKSTDDWYWQDEDAAEWGFEKFPYPAPKIIKSNVEEGERYYLQQLEKREAND